MDLLEAYRELDRMGVTVARMKFQSLTALASPLGVLGLDDTKFETTAEELEILLHEIGHFQTSAFYDEETPYLARQKAERAADRYVFEKFYPPSFLAALMRAGCVESWDLADRLGLPETFVQEMLRFYTQARGVDFNTLPPAHPPEPSGQPSPEAAAPPPQRDPPPAPAPPSGSSTTLPEWRALCEAKGVHLALAKNATLADLRQALAIAAPYLGVTLPPLPESP